MYPSLFHLDFVALPTYSAFCALGLVALLFLALYTGQKVGVASQKLWNLAIWAILAGILADKLLLIATHLWIFRVHPFWVLGMSSQYDPWIPGVSFAIGCAVGLLYALAEGLGVRSVLDALAPALVLASGIAAVGAFLAGARFGSLTHSSWAVSYSSAQAALFYQTPLNRPLHPVQLYQAVLCLLLLLGLLWWLPRRTQAGEVAGFGLFTYGLICFWLECYRGAVQLAGIFTPMQWISLGMVLVGAALLWQRVAPREFVEGQKPEEVPAIAELERRS